MARKARPRKKNLLFTLPPPEDGSAPISEEQRRKETALAFERMQEQIVQTLGDAQFRATVEGIDAAVMAARKQLDLTFENPAFLAAVKKLQDDGIAAAKSILEASLAAREQFARLDLSAVAMGEEVWNLLAEFDEEEGAPDYWECSKAIFTILEERKEQDSIARELLEDRAEMGRFAGVVLNHVRKVRNAVGMGDGAELPDNEEDAIRFARDVDESLARYLETMGGSGEDTARWVREDSKRLEEHLQGDDPRPGRRWRLWVHHGGGKMGAFPFLVYLAGVTWEIEVRPELERKRRNLPALALPLVEFINRAQRPGAKVRNDLLEDRDGIRVAAMRRPALLEIPTARIEAVGALVDAGAGLLGSLNSHRLVRWIVPEAHTRAMDGEPDPRVLGIDGGWSALANQIGARSKKGSTEVRAIVAAMAHLWFELRDGSGGNLLSYRERDAVGQRAAWVELTLGTALLPSFVVEKEKTLDRDERRLVPVVPLPPLVGGARSHGQQATLQFRVMAEFRRRAPEMVKEGGVRLTWEQWEKLAKGAALNNADTLRLVLDRWTQDGDDGGAFLIRDGDLYAPADPAVRAFIEEGGRRELAGGKGGRKSRKKKAARIHGKRKAGK